MAYNILKTIPQVIQTALGLKANLASPALTGTPTAPSAASTVDSTQIATTAMVQDVNEASGSRTTITASAATNYNITASSAQNRRQVVDVSATLTSGTATLTTQTTNAQAGDERVVTLTVSAGSGIFELRNATSGGTLLGTIYGDSAQARVWVATTRYNGTAWGAATIIPLNTGDYISEMDAYRTPEAWTYIDGATANRSAGVFALGARGNIAGAPTFTLLFDFTVPVSNPATTISLFAANASASLNLTAANQFVIQGCETGGGFRIQANAASSSHNRGFYYAGFRAAYAGQRVRGRVVLTQGTTNPVVEVNGVDISASFSASTVGTFPAWLDSSLSVGFGLIGFEHPTGRAPKVIPILGALTSTEAINWRLRGVIPSWVRAGGSAVELITPSDNRDFTGGLGSWAGQSTSAGMSVTGGVATFSGTSQYYYNAGSSPCVPGSAYLLEFDLVENTSGLAITAGIGGGGGVFSAAVGRKSIQFVATSNARLNVFIGSFSTSAFKVDNFTLKKVGAITLPEVTPDNILRDTSAQLSPPIDGYTIGCIPQTGAADGWIRARRTTDGFLMADAQIVGPNRGIVQAMARSVSGGTITLGDTAGAPATLVASISLTAGVTTPLTLLKSITTGGKIYLDLGTATDAEIFIRTGPISSTLVN
jgi:hypothetical protein